MPAKDHYLARYEDGQWTKRTSDYNSEDRSGWPTGIERDIPEPTFNLGDRVIFNPVMERRPLRGSISSIRAENDPKWGLRLTYCIDVDGGGHSGVGFEWPDNPEQTAKSGMKLIT